MKYNISSFLMHIAFLKSNLEAFNVVISITEVL